MEKRQIKKNNEILIYISVFAVSLVFYLLWYFIDGIILTEDAPSYINMQSDREPGYCLYLLLLRKTFGAGVYLHAAVIGQCIVAAIAACAIAVYIKKQFGILGGIGALFIQYGITLLNRFVAQRRYSYYNSIETEGLAYSLWIFFFIAILGILYKKDRKFIIYAAAWSAVLILIRKHMLISLIILFFAVISAYLREDGWKKAFLYSLTAAAAVLALARFGDCTYNYAVRGEFAAHTGDSSFILGTQIYLADSSMERYITEEEKKAVFNEIMEKADENEYNISYAGRGWQNIEEHYSNSYDRIKFNIVNTVINEHQEKSGIAYGEREADYNETVDYMVRRLFIPCFPGLIKLYFCNVVHGLVTTILKTHRLLNWAALITYIMFIAAAIMVFKIRKNSVNKESANPVYFALLVLFSIFVNVCFTSLTIYCQMRYMLYNTGLFYQAFLVMFLEIWGNLYEKNRLSSELS